jgi:hypothetical protein
MTTENQPDDKRRLTPKARELLSASKEIRIEHIKKRKFINYARSESILRQMEELLRHPHSNRPPNLLIVGASKNGKTEILKSFMEGHPAQEQRDGDSIFAPVIYIEAPPGPNEKLFLSAALKVLGIEPKFNSDSSVLIPLLIDTLRKAGVKVMLLDELHSILAGSAIKQRAMLTLLKYISNQTGVSIVAAGTRDAKIALSTDAQLESRFPAIALPLWTDEYLEDSKHVNELDRLLASFETVLPLRQASNLHAKMLKSKILGNSEGLLGGIWTTIQDTAIIAINTEKEAITEGILSQYIEAQKVAKKEADDI